LKVVGLVSRLPKGQLGVHIPAGEKEFFFLEKHPDQLWGPLSHIFHVYRVPSQI